MSIERKHFACFTDGSGIEANYRVNGQLICCRYHKGEVRYVNHSQSAYRPAPKREINMALAQFKRDIAPYLTEEWLALHNALYAE